MKETAEAVKAHRQFETYVAGVFADSKNHFEERQARKKRRQSDWVRIKGSQLAVYLGVVIAVAGATALVVGVAVVKFLIP